MSDGQDRTAQERPLTLLFFGTSGAGKGTQVRMLVEHLRERSQRGIIHIDMGAELRRLRDTGTLTGKLTGEIIDGGNRVRDFLAIYLQTKCMVEEFTGEEHFVADGVARGPDQTRALDDMLQFYGRTDPQVINLVISEETAVARLLGRGRNDDTEEGIRKRLAWAKTDMLPQLALFQERGRTIHEINGEPDTETIHKQIRSVLGLS